MQALLNHISRSPGMRSNFHDWTPQRRTEATQLWVLKELRKLQEISYRVSPVYVLHAYAFKTLWQRHCSTLVSGSRSMSVHTCQWSQIMPFQKCRRLIKNEPIDTLAPGHCFTDVESRVRLTRLPWPFFRNGEQWSAWKGIISAWEAALNNESKRWSVQAAVPAIEETAVKQESRQF